MTQTAHVLCMTQPSVSQAVAELESHYQVRLFDRLGKKLYLTAAGRDLLMCSSQILDQVESAEQLFSTERLRRRVRLGASATVGSFLMSGLLDVLYKKEPLIEVNFEIANTAQIEESLLHARLDMALVEGEVHSLALQTQVVLADELVCVGHPRLLPSMMHYKAQDFKQKPFIMRESGSGTAEQAKAVLARWGVEPRMVGSVNSIDAIHRLVRAGVGFAFLPRLTVAQDLAHGDLVAVSFSKQRIERNIQWVCHRSRSITGDLEMVKRLIMEYFKTAPI